MDYFKFSRSHYFFSYIFLATLFSMGIIVTLEIPWLLKILGIAGVIIYTYFCLRRQGFLKYSSAIIGIKHIEKKDWYLLTPTNQYRAELLGNSTITAKLSILRFQIPGKYFAKTCVIFPDSLPCEHYKQLLVRLKAY